MSDDELSVRLEWPERSNEPFSPTSDEPDRGPGDLTDAEGTELGQLRRTVVELRTELADLRAEVERLCDAVGVERPEPVRRRARREPLAAPRPINVRTRGPKSS